MVPVLETARLRLRAFTAGDGDTHSAMLADPAVARFLGQPASREEAWRKLLSCVGLWPVLGYGYWAVARRQDDRPIGLVGFADFRRDLTPSIEGLPEMGWIFAAEAHGQGYGTEAGEAALRWIDSELGPREITAIISPGNAASIALARKLGFREDGRSPYKGDEVLIFRR